MSEYLIYSIILICIFPLILMGMNAVLDYQRIKNTSTDPEDRGISGFRRATIALTLIITIGIALFHLIAGGIVKEVPGEVVGNVLSMLTGVVASIAGFYFGGKVALDSSPEDSPDNDNGGHKERHQ